MGSANFPEPDFGADVDESLQDSKSPASNNVTNDNIELYIAERLSEIEDLHMPNDTDGEIAVIWMFSKSTKATLLHFIAGALTKDVQHDDDEKWISTNYVTNNRLHKIIEDSCAEKLRKKGVTASKIEHLLKKGPKYLVSTSLPHLKVHDNGDIEGYHYDASSIVDVDVKDPNGTNKYCYSHRNISMEIREPQSPTPVSYLYDFHSAMTMDTVCVCNFLNTL